MHIILDLSVLNLMYNKELISQNNEYIVIDVQDLKFISVSKRIKKYPLL